MTQGLAEFIGQPVQDIMHHSRLLRNLTMAGALSLGALGCGASPTQITTDQPTITSPAPGEGQPSITESTPTSQMERPTTTEALDVHQFDFTNFSFEPDACLDESQPWPVNLIDGSATQENGNNPLSVSIAGDVVYGDITADGSDEALIPLTCDNGRADQINVTQVYSVIDNSLSRLAIIGPSTGAEGIRSKPEKISIQGGQVIIDEARFSPEDPDCCPSQKARLRLYWNGTDFTESSIEILKPPAVTPPVEQPVDQISDEGFSTFDIGMTSDDIEAQGFRTRVRCASTVLIDGADGKLYARLYENKVEAIQTSDPFYKTISGIHADKNGGGSTEEEVRKAYGDSIIATYNLDLEAGTFKTLIFESPQFTKRNKQLLFVIVNGRVQGITEAIKGQKPIVCE